MRTEHLEVRANDSLLSYSRVAVIVGKHGHTIVERNRLRRRLRELTRTRILPGIPVLDMVIRSFSSAYDVTFNELRAEIEIIRSKLLALSGWK